MKKSYVVLIIFLTILIIWNFAGGFYMMANQGHYAVWDFWNVVGEIMLFVGEL